MLPRCRSHAPCSRQMHLHTDLEGNPCHYGLWSQLSKWRKPPVNDEGAGSGPDWSVAPITGQMCDTPTHSKDAHGESLPSNGPVACQRHSTAHLYYGSADKVLDMVSGDGLSVETGCKSSRRLSTTAAARYSQVVCARTDLFPSRPPAAPVCHGKPTPRGSQTIRARKWATSDDHLGNVPSQLTPSARPPLWDAGMRQDARGTRNSIPTPVCVSPPGHVRMISQGRLHKQVCNPC